MDVSGPLHALATSVKERIGHWVGSRDSLTVLGSRKIYIPLRRIEPRTVQPVV